MSPKISLSRDNSSENDMIVITILIGMLNVIEINRKTLDYFGDRLINPYTIDVLRKSPVSNLLSEVLEKCLFLEDYKSFSISDEKFMQMISKIKSELVNLIQSQNHSYSVTQEWQISAGHKWVE